MSDVEHLFMCLLAICMKEMATHSSILAWRIPGTEEPYRLQSTESQSVGHHWGTNILSICISSLEKCLFSSLAHLLIGCSFFWLSCMSCLYILEINSLSVVGSIIFSHSGWESQFLGRLIRSPGSSRRRKGSGTLKEEIGVWGPQGGEKTNFFLVYIPCLSLLKCPFL